MEKRGLIFNIERYAIHDGPGIRTLIFLKGCPLRCLWCQNPEGQKPKPETFHTPSGVITYGRYMSIDEVIKEISKDEVFYRVSNGGITLSGGEPLMQPHFTFQLLKECKKRGIHTAVETSGYAKWNVLKNIAEYTDIFLYDVKVMDPKKHKEYTGVSNSLILENLEKLSKLGKEIIIRVPVIPGYNDSEENMEKLCSFIKRLHLSEIDLLPYNRLAESKYERLGLPYKLKGLRCPSRHELNKLKAIADKYGIRCRIF